MSDQDVIQQQEPQPQATPADGATSETQVESGAAPTEKPSERTYSQKEVDAIAARVERRVERKRERDLGNLESVVEAKVQAELAKLQQAHQPKSQDEAPKRDDFADEAAYLDAQVQYRVDQRLKESSREQERTAKQREQQERQKSIDTKFSEAVQKAASREGFLDDFDTLTRLPLKPDTGQQMIEAIAESDSAPEILDWLAANHEEAKRIGQLSPARAVAEIGKLEERAPWKAATKQSASAQPAPVSKAPPPIDPGSGKGAGGSNVPPTDPDAYLRWHNEQERAKAAARMKRA